MSRGTEATAFTAALAAILLLFLVLAWRLESAGRVAPILLASLALVLVAWQFRRELKGQAPKSAKPAREMRAGGFVWALALPVSLYLLGCLAGMAAHTLLLVRYRGKRSWPTSALIALAASAPVYGLAHLMARTELLTGALWAGL